MLRYLTAGESHGESLVAILDGMPAGLSLSEKEITAELLRRQKGYGRGGRMRIEKDRASILSGVRKGKTMGSPIALTVKNKDFVIDKLPEVTRPRPGHADLAGVLKYDTTDARTILERASARETAARVAVGAVARQLLSEFGIDLLSHVVTLGGVVAKPVRPGSLGALRKKVEASPVRCADQAAGKRMMAKIDQAKKDGDTLGGAIEVVVTGAPVGLGSHAQHDRKLDAALTGALMSIQAIKAVEVGVGTEVSRLLGSKLHDEIFYSKAKGFYRKTHRAGGLEGGMTIGGPVILRLHMKPLATLRRPLKSVDLRSKKAFDAAVERSDVTAVPAAGVVAEGVVAFELARAVVEKFGGDSLKEMKRNLAGYLKQVKDF